VHTVLLTQKRVRIFPLRAIKDRLTSIRVDSLLCARGDIVFVLGSGILIVGLWRCRRR